MRRKYTNINTWVNILLATQRDIQEAFPSYTVSIKALGGMKEISNITVSNPLNGSVIYDQTLKEENRIINSYEIIQDIKNCINKIR